MRKLAELGRVCRSGRLLCCKPVVDEVVEACQRPQTVLAAELVETGHATLPIAQDVERHDVDLPRLRAVETARQLEPLQEARRVLEQQEPEPLTTERQPPTGKPMAVHRRRRFRLPRTDDGNLGRNAVAVAFVAPQLEQVRHQGMQAVDGDELLGKIEGRTEVVHAAIDVVEIGDAPAFLAAARSDNSRAGGKHRVERSPVADAIAVRQVIDDARERRLDDVAAAENAVPVRIHGDVERAVVEELRCPLGRVDLGDQRRDDEPRYLEQLLVVDLPVEDGLGGPLGIAQA